MAAFGEKESDWMQPDQVIPYMLAGLHSGHLDSGGAGCMPMNLDSEVRELWAGGRDKPLGWRNGLSPKLWRATSENFGPKLWGEPAQVVWSSTSAAPNDKVEVGARRFEIFGLGSPKVNSISYGGGTIDPSGRSIDSAFGYCLASTLKGFEKVGIDCYGEVLDDDIFRDEIALVGKVEFLRDDKGGVLFRYFEADLGGFGDVAVEVFAGGGCVEYRVVDDWVESFSKMKVRYDLFERQSLHSVLEVWGRNEFPHRSSYRFSASGKLLSRYSARYNRISNYVRFAVGFSQSGGLTGVTTSAMYMPFRSDIARLFSFDSMASEAESMVKMHTMFEANHDELLAGGWQVSKEIWRDGFLVCELRYRPEDGDIPEVHMWSEMSADGDLTYLTRFGEFLRVEF